MFCNAVIHTRTLAHATQTHSHVNEKQNISGARFILTLIYLLMYYVEWHVFWNILPLKTHYDVLGGTLVLCFTLDAMGIKLIKPEIALFLSAFVYFSARSGCCAPIVGFDRNRVMGRRSNNSLAALRSLYSAVVRMFPHYSFSFPETPSLLIDTIIKSLYIFNFYSYFVVCCNIILTGTFQCSLRVSLFTVDF